MDLQERVERLEKLVEELLARTGPGTTITTSCLKITDSQGKEQARLHSSEDGPFLKLFD